MAHNVPDFVYKRSQAKCSHAGKLNLCIITLLLQGWCLVVEVKGEALQQAYLSVVFTRDVLADNALTFISSASLISCSIQCTSRSNCLSFAFRISPTSCWLYARYVEFQTNGTTAPGTRYYWKLQTRCPTERGYALIPGACFKSVSIAGSWNDARDLCTSEGGVLFQCDTPAKLTAFFSIGYKNMWMGASDSLVEGDWRWLNGQRVTSNWKAGQPDDFNNADYMFVAPGYFFDDSPGQAAMSPLCEIPLRQQP